MSALSLSLNICFEARVPRPSSHPRESAVAVHGFYYNALDDNNSMDFVFSVLFFLVVIPKSVRLYTYSGNSHALCICFNVDIRCSSYDSLL
jgi:hypothetical protein